MKLSSLALLLVTLIPIAVAQDGMAYGRLAKTALLSRGALIKPKLEIVYARVRREIFYGSFDDALDKRQVCGSGDTCTAACTACGGGIIWCGTETGGSCDCSDLSGSCPGAGGSSGERRISRLGDEGEDICGRGRTCTGACRACGPGWRWCGTDADGVCRCCDGVGGSSGLSSFSTPTSTSGLSTTASSLDATTSVTSATSTSLEFSTSTSNIELSPTTTSPDVTTSPGVTTSATGAIPSAIDPGSSFTSMTNAGPATTITTSFPTATATAPTVSSSSVPSPATGRLEVAVWGVVLCAVALALQLLS